MFNPYSLAIFFAGLVTLSLTYRTPRAWLWLWIGGASFVSSALYWDFGNRQWHPIFTFTCDSLVCLSLHLWLKEKWELGVFACFLLSTFVSLLMVADFVPDTVLYASMLELCNWAALFVLGGTGLMDLISKNEDSVVGRLHGSLHSARHSL